MAFKTMNNDYQASTSDKSINDLIDRIRADQNYVVGGLLWEVELALKRKQLACEALNKALEFESSMFEEYRKR